jgi:hypothetical protein
MRMRREAKEERIAIIKRKKRIRITSQKNPGYLFNLRMRHTPEVVGKRSAHREYSHYTQCLGTFALEQVRLDQCFTGKALRKTEGGYNWLRKRGSSL